jgi:hypothetical protein
MINEIFDSSLPYNTSSESIKYGQFDFSINDITYTVNIKRSAWDQSYEVNFVAQRHGHGMSIDPNGWGNQYKVFSTVIKIMGEYARRYPVTKYSFKANGKLAKVYQRLIQSQLEPGWRMTRRNEMGGQIAFEIELPKLMREDVFKPWVELHHAGKKENLSSDGKGLLKLLHNNPRELVDRLKNEITTGRQTNPEEAKKFLSLLHYKRTPSVEQYVEFLQNKWKKNPIKEARDWATASGISTEIKIPNTGLGLSRADMPQIRQSVMDHFLKKLEQDGNDSRVIQVPTTDLRPTQDEFNHDKIKEMMGQKQTGKPIIISKDRYILDGHHRWAAQYNLNNQSKISATQIDMNILDLLSAARNYKPATYHGVNESIKQLVKSKGKTSGEGSKPVI